MRDLAVRRMGALAFRRMIRLAFRCVEKENKQNKQFPGVSPYDRPGVSLY